MNKYNVDGETHLGYARYVDDIVLLASSSTLLEELRELVDLKTRNLDLALIAKADAIPPMSAEEFSEYVNQGRALEASGPAWEPPLAGDGEAGWEFWSELLLQTGNPLYNYCRIGKSTKAQQKQFCKLSKLHF
ncbi:hypothetical protein HG619_10105 [Pseudomonas syringae]|nr:hypothetical protein [Pseudomonas syringae]